MFDVCGTFFQSEAARRGGGIGGAVAAACLAHGRPPRVGCAHVLPAASPARVRIHCAVLSLPDAGFFLRSAARVSCAPPPAFPVWPIPAPARVIRTALSLRAAGFVRRVALRPPARVLRAALSLRAAGFAHPPREGWILAASQRVPCPPRHPARASASTVQSYPCLPPVFSCALPPAFPVRPIPAPARVIRTALSLRAAGFVRPRRPARAGFCLCPAGRADIGRESARALSAARRVALRARPHPLCSPIPACRRFFPSLRRPPPPARPIPARRVRIHCAVLSLPAAGFFLRSAGRADIGREPARTVPAASPCAPPACVPCAA